MWGQLWDVLRLVCIVVGALTLWALTTLPIFVWVLRRARGPASPRPQAESRRVERAGSWADVPSWVKHDKEWAAAVVLLGSDAIAEQTTPFVDFPARRIDWLGLRLAAADWPGGDKLLVEVAYDLAYGQHDGAGDGTHASVTVADLAQGLAQSELDLVHEAVGIRRGDRP